MKLLDRYLQEVSSLLPSGQRDDILAELREEIMTLIEQREERLGRSLDDADVEDILGQFGHPAVVAGRYQPDHGSFTFGKWQIIGPELFPFYRKGLLYIGSITLAVLTVVLLVLAQYKQIGLNEVLGTLLTHIGLQFVIQTVVWASIQAHASKFPNRWRSPAKPDPLRVSRWDSGLQLVILVALLPWVHSVLWPTKVEVHPGQLNETWHHIYFPIVFCMLVGIFQSVVNLVKPEWVRLRSTCKLFISSVSLISICYVLRAGNWVVQGSSSSVIEIEFLNLFVFMPTLVVMAVALAIQVPFDLRAFIRDTAIAPKLKLQDGLKQS